MAVKRKKATVAPPPSEPSAGMPMSQTLGPVGGLGHQGMSMQAANMTQGMPAGAIGQLGMPGMPMPQPSTAPLNPMAMMMQMMQLFSSGMLPGMSVDSAAQPFRASVEADTDPGLAADLIRPALLDNLLREQEPLPAHELLDLLCLRPDGKRLGGLPKGCTIAFVGPPGKGKSRTCLAALAKLAATGTRVGYVVAEEGFRDDVPGRDDLCSRMTKIAMQVLKKKEAEVQERVLDKVVVIEATYHKGWTWEEFIARYRTMVEKEGCMVTIVDSLNMLDPTKRRTADNLSALKTYNHKHGVTCLCVGQIKDGGEPQGGEALMHTADCVFMLEEMSLGSKEIAEVWGGQYRDRIDVIRAIKCVTTPIHPHPIRVDRNPEHGALIVHDKHPKSLPLPS